MKLLFTLILALFAAGCFAPTEAAFTRGKLVGRLESTAENITKSSEQKDLYIAKNETDKALAELYKKYLANRALCENDDEVAWVVEDYIEGRAKTLDNGVKEYWRLNESTQDTLLLKQGFETVNTMADRELNVQRVQLKEFFEKDFVETIAPALLAIADKYKATTIPPPEHVKGLEAQPVKQGDSQ